MKTNTKWGMGILFGIMFLIWIVLVKTVDVACVGPVSTSIGLSHWNKGVHDFLGVHWSLYRITEILGMVCIAVAGAFALLGAWQLVTRKSLRKVDAAIWTLGGLYVVVLFFYALFEKVVINYRPVIMPDAELMVEPSFPSSHTMLSCVIMGSTIMVLRRYINNERLCTALQFVCGGILIAIVIGRFLCGVHWFSDIVGGILLSSALLFFYSGVNDKFVKSNLADR